MESTVLTEIPESQRSKQVLKTISWSLFALFCLLFFTLLRIPQTKITATVLGLVNQELSGMGYSVSADEGKIKVGLGLYYEFTGVKVLKSANQKSLNFSKLELHPSLIALAQGKIGGNVLLEEGEGRITGEIFLKDQKPDIDLKVESLNLGRIGLLPFLSDFQGSAEVKGTFKLVDRSGQVNLELSRISFDEARIQGFQIPKLSIATGAVDLDLNQPNLTIKTLRLGRSGSSDDLFTTVKGTAKISNYIENSDVNVKVELGLSPKLQQSFSLLDAFLGQMKQKDGSYKFKLEGPLAGSMPQPDNG